MKEGATGNPNETQRMERELALYVALGLLSAGSGEKRGNALSEPEPE